MSSPSAQTSIVVVTFNNRSEIDTCLRSLQACSDGAEIIVVDNQSTDGTLAYVHRYFPQVTTVTAERNRGFGAGVNLGIPISHGEYIAVINPDTEVKDGWLRPLIDVLATRSHVGLVTPTILLRDSPDRINACGNNVHLTGLTFCAGLHQLALSPSSPARHVTAISGAAFVMRRTLWTELGGFDERFFMYLEDTDLSLRAHRLGYEVLHVPASRIWHAYSVKLGAAKLYHLEHNRLLMLRKNLSLATLAILLPALITTEVIVWAYCVRGGQAYRSAKWRSYRQLWIKRHTVKQQRTSVAWPSDRYLIRTTTARLSIDQLQNNPVISLVNHVLTVIFTLWRYIALAIVWW